MHPIIPTIGSIIWLLIFAAALFTMYELIRIDRKIIKDKDEPPAEKQPITYKHRAVWIGIIIGVVLFPLIIGTLVKGFAFGKAWFVVSFGFIPWLIAQTSFFGNSGFSAVAVISLVIYTLAVAFFALVFRHNQKSTYIVLSAITVLVLILLYILSFNIAVSTILGFHR